MALIAVALLSNAPGAMIVAVTVMTVFATVTALVVDLS
jgi:hypothetical protein